MTSSDNNLVDELRLRRFARLVAPLLGGTASQGVGTRAAHNRAGSGLEFFDVRAYTPGDELRHVDWRQSSRRGQAMVRRYREESASDWFLCVDGSASMAIGDKWRLATELASALAYALLFSGHRVALMIFAARVETYCPVGRGRRHFGTILRRLLDFEPAEQGGASLPGLCAGSVSHSANLVLISDFLREDGMADDIRRLRERSSAVRALQVLGADELRLPATGPARLFDVESGAERRFTASPATQDAATDALQRHNERLKQFFAKLDIRFSACVAGDDWERVLVKHLRA